MTVINLVAEENLGKFFLQVVSTVMSSVLFARFLIVDYVTQL